MIALFSVYFHGIVNSEDNFAMPVSDPSFFTWKIGCNGFQMYLIVSRLSVGFRGGDPKILFLEV